MPRQQADALRNALAQIQKIRRALEEVLKDMEILSDQISRAEENRELNEEEISDLKYQIQCLSRNTGR
jgi:hypothetical protein